MARGKYAVKLRDTNHKEYRGGHAEAIALDMEKQAAEKADLLNRMKSKNSPDDPVEDNPFVALLFMLAGVGLGTLVMIVFIKLIGA